MPQQTEVITFTGYPKRGNVWEILIRHIWNKIDMSTFTGKQRCCFNDDCSDSGARCHQVPVPEPSPNAPSCRSSSVGTGLQWRSRPPALKALNLRGRAAGGMHKLPVLKV